MNDPSFFIFNNDEWHPTTHLHPADRGLAYGDGIFETIFIKHKNPRLLNFHMERLHDSAHKLLLPPPPPALAHRLQQLAKAQTQTKEWDTAIAFKIIYSRGVTSRGYAIPPDSTPTLLLAISSLDDKAIDELSRGVTVRYGQWRLALQPHLAGIKHLNRLEQVLARSEWSDPDIFESLLLDQNDHLIEGVMSNLFIVKDHHLLTPSLERAGVKGVMRRAVMEQASIIDIPCKECLLTIEDFEQCSEAFLTNAIIGIAPITQCEQRSLRIGSITKKLQEKLALIV